MIIIANLFKLLFIKIVFLKLKNSLKFVILYNLSFLYLNRIKIFIKNIYLNILS